MFLSTLRWHSKFQKARRIEDRDSFRDMRLEFQTLQAPDGLIDSLRATARAMGATVNDLFLAAIVRRCVMSMCRQSEGIGGRNWRWGVSWIFGQTPGSR